VPIFIGGMIAHLTDNSGATESMKKKGILMASGLITGEALMGILVAVPIFITSDKDWWPVVDHFGWAGMVMFIGIISWLFYTVTNKK